MFTNRYYVKYKSKYINFYDLLFLLNFRLKTEVDIDSGLPLLKYAFLL